MCPRTFLVHFLHTYPVVWQYILVALLAAQDIHTCKKCHFTLEGSIYLCHGKSCGLESTVFPFCSSLIESHIDFVSLIFCNAMVLSCHLDNHYETYLVTEEKILNSILCLGNQFSINGLKVLMAHAGSHTIKHPR